MAHPKMSQTNANSPLNFGKIQFGGLFQIGLPATSSPTQGPIHPRGIHIFG